jgi:hypothetical protein
MRLRSKVPFETEICEHLAANGWLYAEGDAAGYDRARALLPADVLQELGDAPFKDRQDRQRGQE